MKPTYQKTIVACFIGYIVQAVINNFIPLLFVTFQENYLIPMGQIAVLISVNFIVQLIVDVLAARYVEQIGYRRAVLIAHVFSASGLLLLTVMPEILDPFIGIVLSVVIYAIGGGLIEVMISPIMEACPTENKSAAMSLLHSFYCWGHVGVVLLSTLFFGVAGVDNWKWLTVIWALIPVVNLVMFSNAPIGALIAEGEQGMTLKELALSKTFWILFVMMLCAGASEQALIQWASVFAEHSLQIPKAIGDIAGPMAFAVCMGIARAIYGKCGNRFDLHRFMYCSTILCIGSYLLAALAPLPILNLLGCACCGLSVGILWPGTYSKASAAISRGGAAMFALLAVAGDLGCSVGPAVVGIVADACAGNLKTGFLVASVFPILLLCCFRLEKRSI